MPGEVIPPGFYKGMAENLYNFHSKTISPAGGKIILKHLDSPLVAVNLWALAGVKNESPSTNGISHFYEHMVFKGTDNYPGNLLARKVQALGGYFNAGTSLDTTDFYIVVPAEFWKEAIEILTEMVCRPLFSPTDIEQEKLVVIQEIHIDQDDPEERLTTLLHQKVFANTPYEMPILGKEERVRSFTRADLLEHQRRFYHASNLALIVAGGVPVGAEEVFQWAEERFPPASGWEQRDFSFPAFAPKKGEFLVPMDVKRRYGVVGFLCPGIQDEAFYPLQLLSLIVGGGIGSRLNLKLREEKKLVDIIQANYFYYQKAGIFAIFYSYMDGNREEIEFTIQQELQRLFSDPPEQGEIIRGKNLLKSGFSHAVETTWGWAEVLGRFDLAGNVDYLADYLLRIDRLKVEDVMKVAELYLNFKKATWISVYPGEEKN